MSYTVQSKVYIVNKQVVRYLILTELVITTRDDDGYSIYCQAYLAGRKTRKVMNEEAKLFGTPSQRSIRLRTNLCSKCTHYRSVYSVVLIAIRKVAEEEVHLSILLFRKNRFYMQQLCATPSKSAATDCNVINISMIYNGFMQPTWE